MDPASQRFFISSAGSGGSGSEWVLRTTDNTCRIVDVATSGNVVATCGTRYQSVYWPWHNFLDLDGNQIIVNPGNTWMNFNATNDYPASFSSFGLVAAMSDGSWLFANGEWVIKRSGIDYSITYHKEWTQSSSIFTTDSNGYLYTPRGKLHPADLSTVWNVSVSGTYSGGAGLSYFSNFDTILTTGRRIGASYGNPDYPAMYRHRVSDGSVVGSWYTTAGSGTYASLGKLAVAPNNSAIIQYIDNNTNESIMRWDWGGSQVWHKRWNTSTYGQLTSITCDQSDGVYAMISTFLVKFSLATGAVVWQTAVYGMSNLSVKCIGSFLYLYGTGGMIKIKAGPQPKAGSYGGVTFDNTATFTTGGEPYVTFYAGDASSTQSTTSTSSAFTRSVTWSPPSWTLTKTPIT